MQRAGAGSRPAQPISTQGRFLARRHEAGDGLQFSVLCISQQMLAGEVEEVRTQSSLLARRAKPLPYLPASF